MEHIGLENYRLLIDNIENGTIKSQQVKDISLKMHVHGVYVSNYEENKVNKELKDVMRMMLDKWWDLKLRRNDVDGVAELKKILADEDIRLQFLAAKIQRLR